MVLRQQRGQRCAVKGAFAGFVDDNFTVRWCQIRNDLVARLARYQNAAHGPHVSDAQAGVAPVALGRRAVQQVGAVRLARVHHQPTGAAPGQQYPLAGGNDC